MYIGNAGSYKGYKLRTPTRPAGIAPASAAGRSIV